LPVSPSSLVANPYDAYPPPHVACPLHLILRLPCRAMSSPFGHPTATFNDNCDGDDWASPYSSDGGTSSAADIRFVQNPLLVSYPRVSFRPPSSPRLFVPPPLGLYQPTFHTTKMPPIVPLYGSFGNGSATGRSRSRSRSADDDNDRLEEWKEQEDDDSENGDVTAALLGSGGPLGVPEPRRGGFFWASEDKGKGLDLDGIATQVRHIATPTADQAI
jgi:hypothetical protein